MFELAQVAVLLVLLPIMLVGSAIVSLTKPSERPAAVIVINAPTVADLPLAEE